MTLSCDGPGSFAIAMGNIRFSRVAMRLGGFGPRLWQPTRRPFVGSWLRVQWLTSPVGSFSRRQKMECVPGAIAERVSSFMHSAPHGENAARYHSAVSDFKSELSRVSYVLEGLSGTELDYHLCS